VLSLAADTTPLERLVTVPHHPGPSKATTPKGAEMTDWEKQIGAMTLYVPDLARGKAFYQDAFGLEGREVGGDSVMFRFKDTYVFLRESTQAGEPPGEIRDEALNGAGQFAIIVEDVDAVSAELTEHGVELLSGPADRPWGMRTVTFADPAGHFWEIAQEI
jgi:catechol 2,3-dioxygenase-like lactoylglutathione lyase family enzyme